MSAIEQVQEALSHIQTAIASLQYPANPGELAAVDVSPSVSDARALLLSAGNQGDSVSYAGITIAYAIATLD